MQPFYELGEDYEFWQHTGEGLAVFASQDQCIVYKIERPVKEFTVVANSFHIKPLIRVFQSADRYHLLGISRRHFALRSQEHTSELQSRGHLVCRLLLEKKKKITIEYYLA